MKARKSKVVSKSHKKRIVHESIALGQHRLVFLNRREDAVGQVLRAVGLLGDGLSRERGLWENYTSKNHKKTYKK